MDYSQKKKMGVGLVVGALFVGLAYGAFAVQENRRAATLGQRYVSLFNAVVSQATKREGCAFKPEEGAFYFFDQTAQGGSAVRVFSSAGETEIALCPVRKGDDSRKDYSEKSDTDFAMTDGSTLYWMTITPNKNMVQCIVDAQGSAKCSPYHPEDRKALLKEITGQCQDIIGKAKVETLSMGGK